jgi:hypothetical protein
MYQGDMTHSPRFRLQSLNKIKAFLVLTWTCVRQAVSAGLHSEIFQKKILVFTAVRISNMTQHNRIVLFLLWKVCNLVCNLSVETSGTRSDPLNN